MTRTAPKKEPLLRFTGFSEEHKPFDKNDPHSAIAERERKITVNKLLVAMTMQADKNMAAMAFSGTLMGTMTGCAEGVLSMFGGTRQELEQAFLDVAKETFFLAWENKRHLEPKP